MRTWQVAGAAVWVVIQAGGVRAEEPAKPSSDRAVMTVVSSGARSADAAAEPVDVPEPMRLSLQFQDANIKDVLKAFSEQTGINVIASEEVGDRTVTLYLDDVTAMDALDQILQASGLVYERPPGSQIYIVKQKTDKPQIVTITRVYPLKYARVSSSRLAQAVASLSSSASSSSSGSSGSSGGSSSGSSSSGSSSGSGSTSGTSGSSGTSSGSSSGGGSGVGIDSVIGKVLTKEGQVVVDSRTNRLIVSDVPENFPRIEAIINALDIRTAQILIESEILETSLTKLKDLGVKWGTGSAGEMATFTPAAGANKSTRFPFGFFGKSAPVITDPRFSLSTLDVNEAKRVLQALEQDEDTKILARPKVLTLDNESAQIRLTSNQATGFTTTTTQTSSTATPERTTTGVSLDVTPQVNDGGFITMLVQPTVTGVVTAAVTPPTSVGGTVVDPKTRSAKTLVRVLDGQTLVIGGLIDRNERFTVRSVPVVSGIPVLGEAFKHRETDNTVSELVVFVTPHILKEGPGAQVASAQPPFPIREQENPESRQELMEQTLKRLE